jgi:hypothetical protein
LEEIWVREMVDLLWEILRLRRLKASLLNGSMAGRLEDVLATLRHQSIGFSLEDESLVAAWANGDPDSRKNVAQQLAKAGLSMDAVVAAASAKKLDAFERFDRMIASAEARRNNALREIDRHRTPLGAALRAAMEEPEDAVFTDAETGLVANGSAQSPASVSDKPTAPMRRRVRVQNLRRAKRVQRLMRCGMGSIYPFISIPRSRAKWKLWRCVSQAKPPTLRLLI